MTTVNYVVSTITTNYRLMVFILTKGLIAIFPEIIERDPTKANCSERERKERVGLSCFQITHKKQWEISRGTTVQE